MAKAGTHGGNRLQMAQQVGLDPEQIVDFSANINPLGVPDSLKTLISENLDQLAHYPDIDYTELHQELANHHQIDSGCVLAGNGATELIFLWAQIFKPQKALIFEPTFGEYRQALKRANCDITTVQLTEAEKFTPQLSHLEHISDDLDCVFICTPNNPTGLLPNQDFLQRLITRCREKQVALFVDESFMDFLPNQPSLVSQLAQLHNVFVLRSMTKFFAIPGLRLGYLLSSNVPLLQAMHQAREPWTINTFAALAPRALLQDTQYQNASHQWLVEQNRYLKDSLTQFSQLDVYPSLVNYVFFKLLVPSLDLQNELLKHSILIRSCGNYSGLDHSFYRVAVKSADDNRKLIQALTNIFES